MHQRTMALLALAATTACSTVKVMQREGCWVRRTERPGSVKEELGPCARPEPKWAEDRITRIMQECVSQADWRWQQQALDAWSRGTPLPPRPTDDALLKACLDESARTALAEKQQLEGKIAEATSRLQEATARLEEEKAAGNERARTLKSDADARLEELRADAKARLDELKADHAALAARSEEDRSRLMETFDRIAGDLGDAAKKPLPPATATASATTSATSDGTYSETTESTPPTTTVVTAPAAVTAPPGAVAAAPIAAPAASSAPACAPETPTVAAAAKKRAGHRAARSKPVRCDPATGAAPAAEGAQITTAGPGAPPAKPEVKDASVVPAVPVLPLKPEAGSDDRKP